ncbi:MAG: hypothetical protein JSV96_11785 [Candidatus Aminicenantes bacterium]|nr:MAG: hypothetical protein JSV96_11785 [Candidatus Aminicenantes bacterium]
MAKCSKCNKRKAKRYCIAIGEHLCSLCCGLLREKEIHCPPNCTFLEKHRPYQEKRIIEKKRPVISRRISHEEEILSDERMAWLAFHIEAPLKEYSETKESFRDKEAILALEYAKEKIEKGKGFLIIPNGKSGPKDEVGEAIYQNVEKCRYEKKIILPGEAGAYKKEDKIQCLERIILSVKLLAKDNLGGRNYIKKLHERFSKIDELSRMKKISPIT